MKKTLIALSGTLLLSGCFGVDQSLAPETNPWTMDPEAAYGATNEIDSESSVATAENADDGQRSPFRNGCKMIIRTVWAETDQGRYVIEAESKSEDCENAELSLAIRAPNRVVVHRANLRGDEVYGFTEIADPIDMRGALINWATNYGALTRRSGRLPYWPQGAIHPRVGGEFPMIVNEAWDRVDYLAVRNANVPVYCHVVDLDSLICFVLHDAELDVVELGIQKFPRRPTEPAAEGAVPAEDAQSAEEEAVEDAAALEASDGAGEPTTTQ